MRPSYKFQCFASEREYYSSVGLQCFLSMQGYVWENFVTHRNPFDVSDLWVEIVAISWSSSLLLLTSMIWRVAQWVHLFWIREVGIWTQGDRFWMKALRSNAALIFSFLQRVITPVVTFVGRWISILLLLAVNLQAQWCVSLHVQPYTCFFHRFPKALQGL